MRKLCGLLAVVAFLVSANGVRAEETHVSVGLKTWFATWTESFGGEEIESDVSLLIGPTIGVRSGNFFGGLTYMFGTFTFPDQDVCDPFFGCISIGLEADRADLDLVAGYNLHPNFGAFLGYKKADFTLTVTCPGCPSDEFDATFSGPVLGLNFNAPLGESRWILFGNMSYLLLEYEDDDFKEDAPGFSIELAGAYSLENAPVNLTVGYKFQSVTGEDSDVTDEFSGVTLGANYTF